MRSRYNVELYALCIWLYDMAKHQTTAIRDRMEMLLNTEIDIENAVVIISQQVLSSLRNAHLDTYIHTHAHQNKWHT